MLDTVENGCYLKLLQEIRVGWEEEVLILPPGRCLLIADQNEDGVFAELEQEGAGYLFFKHGDSRVVQATLEDTADEPNEQDRMEYRDDYPDVYKRRYLATTGPGSLQANQ